MRSAIVGILVLIGSMVLAPTRGDAITGVLCIKATGKGAVKVRNPTCKTTAVQVGTFDTDTAQASLTPQDVSVRASYNGPAAISSEVQAPFPFGVGSEEYD